MLSRETFFQLAPDAVDPAKVPFKTLSTGARIPGIGLGTFSSDGPDSKKVASAVREALSLGYRHLDCASVYGNEAEIGKVLAEVLGSGLIAREELWVTSKVWNDKHGEGDVLRSCIQSLKDLQLDYLDLILLHWPFPNYHPPGCSVDSRSPDSQPYIHQNYMKTWQQMEDLVDRGLARHIGTSNMTIPKLELVLRDCRLKPTCNEMELHPHFQQPEFFNYLVERDILPIGFSPLGSPGRPERDRMEEDTVAMEDPVVVAMAERLGLHPAMICLKWALQRGQVPIPFSVRRQNIRNNLLAVVEKPLGEEDMKALAGVDKNCRLIKGQVFLWKDGQDWSELWDIDGTIPPL